MRRRTTLGTDLKGKLQIKSGADVMDEGEEGRKESVLMNPLRAKVLEYVSRFPCTTPSHLSKLLDCSTTTIEWHIRKLTKREFVRVHKYPKKVLYYLPNSLKEEEIAIFHAINQSMVSRDIYDYIKAHGGESISEISQGARVSYQSVRWHVRAFSNLGIVEVLKDGRNHRVYLTKTLKQRQNTHGSKRADMVRRSILKMLKADSVEFELLPSRPGKLEVLLKVGTRHNLLTLVLNPYLTL